MMKLKKTRIGECSVFESRCTMSGINRKGILKKTNSPRGKSAGSPQRHLLVESETRRAHNEQH